MSTDQSIQRDEPLVKIDCKQDLLRAVRFNADGQYALTCGSDRTIKLWRPSKLLLLKCYKGHSADVIDCQANHDSSRLLSCSNDKSLIVWDVETGKTVRRFRNMAPYTSVCYGPNSTSALASSIDGTVRIYDLRALNAWDPIQSLTEASDSVTCCKISGEFIVTTSLDKKLRTYDVRFGSLTIDTLDMALNHVAINQKCDEYLVTCLRGRTLLLDKKLGKQSAQFEGNENKLFKLESSYVLADSCIASGSEDGQVYIWNRESQDLKYRLVHKDCGVGSKQTPPVIQSISSDTLDLLLTSCGGYMLMWSL